MHRSPGLLWLPACCRRTPSVTVDRAIFLRASTRRGSGSRVVFHPRQAPAPLSAPTVHFLPLAVPTLGPSTIHRHRHDPCITNALCHRAGVVAALLPAVAAPPSVTLDRATSLRPPMLPGCGSRTVFHDAGSAPLGLRATTVAPSPSAQHLVRGCCLLACAAAAPLLSSSGSGCFGVPRRCCAACERSFHCRLRSIRSTLSFFHPT
jgi:hypothetical protein